MTTPSGPPEALRLLSLVEELGRIGHWWVDLVDQTLHWSPQVHAIHGLEGVPAPPLEVAIDMYHPDDRAMVRQVVADAVGRHEGFDFRARLIRADGAVRWVSSAGRVTIEEGQAVTLFGVFKDVTEEQVDLGTSAARLESLATLASGLAHEINNPLTSMLSSLHQLDRLAGDLDPPARAEAAELLAEVREGAEQVQGVIRELQTFAVPGAAADGDAFGIDEAIQAAWTMVRVELRSKAQVAFALEAGVQVPGQRPDLVQVLVHLLRNAAQAVGRREGPGHVQVRSMARRGRVVVEVEDDGPGLPPSARERVFEPFFTTRTYGDAAGLGLYVARNVVQGLGGHLGCESRPGRTVFRLVLPVVPDPEATSNELPRLLLVDDDPLVARTVGRSLRQHFAVEVAHSADAASALLAAGGAPFEVLVTDIGMPGRSGWDLLTEVRRDHPALLERALVITGGSDVAPAAVAGVPVLRKPFTPQQLAIALGFEA